VIVATGDQGSGGSRHAPSMWSGTRFRTSRKSRESTVKQPLKGDSPENRRMSPIFLKIGECPLFFSPYLTIRRTQPASTRSPRQV
jgi:hypothetical protein